MLVSWASQQPGQRGGGGPPAPSYAPESVAYFNAMTVNPSDTDKTRIDTLVKALLAAGVWSKLNWLNLYAIHDGQAGRVNAKTPTQVAVAINSPSHTAYRGFNSDGATSYIDTGYSIGGTPSPFTQDNATVGVWIGTDVTSGTAQDIGGRIGRTGILSRTTATNAGYAANAAAAGSVALPVATSAGHTSWVRDNSADYIAYKNGVALQTIVAASTISIAPILVCCGYNTFTLAPANFSTRRQAISYFGTAITGTEMSALHSALDAYIASLP